MRRVLKGQAFIDPAVTKKVFCQLKKNPAGGESPAKRPSLSHRELQILSFLVEGNSNREIADTICLSPDTVKTHLKNVYQKLGVRNRSQAATVAIQEKLVRLSR